MSLILRHRFSPLPTSRGFFETIFMRGSAGTILSIFPHGRPTRTSDTPEDLEEFPSTTRSMSMSTTTLRVQCQLRFPFVNGTTCCRNPGSSKTPPPDKTRATNDFLGAKTNWLTSQYLWTFFKLETSHRRKQKSQPGTGRVPPGCVH